MNNFSGSLNHSACADGGGIDALPEIMVVEEEIKERIELRRQAGDGMEAVMGAVQDILDIANLSSSGMTNVSVSGVQEIILRCTKSGKFSFTIGYMSAGIPYKYSDERTGLWPSVVKELEAIFGVAGNPRIVGGVEVMVLTRNQSFYRIVRYQRPPASSSGDTLVERVEIFLHQGENLYKPY